ENKFGVDIDLRIKGILSLGPKEMQDELLKQATLQKSFGIPADVLEASEILKIAPFVNTADIGIGLYCKDDAIFDPYPIVQAYAKHAKLRGAKILEGVKASAILIKNRRVVGVATSIGTISTPIVVNAAGAWAGKVGKWAGINIPLRNSVRHQLITEPSSI